MFKFRFWVNRVLIHFWWDHITFQNCEEGISNTTSRRLWNPKPQIWIIAQQLSNMRHLSMCHFHNVQNPLHHIPVTTANAFELKVIFQLLHLLHVLRNHLFNHLFAFHFF